MSSYLIVKCDRVDAVTPVHDSEDYTRWYIYAHEDVSPADFVSVGDGKWTYSPGWSFGLPMGSSYNITSRSGDFVSNFGVVRSPMFTKLVLSANSIPTGIKGGDLIACLNILYPNVRIRGAGLYRNHKFTTMQ